MIHSFTLTHADSGLTFEMELDPDQRLYCFVGENGVGKTALLETIGGALWWTHFLFVAKSNEKTFGELPSSTQLFEALSDRYLTVPTGEAEGKRLKFQNWKSFPLSAFWQPYDGIRPILTRSPLVYIPANQRATVDGIGAAALRLAEDEVTSFTQSVLRSQMALHREAIDTTTVSMWMASRLLINPSFMKGVRDTSAEVHFLLQLLSAFDPDRFSGLVSRSATGAVEFDISFQGGKLYFHGRPIDRLASGYMALIKILQEIVSTVISWETMRGAKTPEEFQQTDAIILIDEIDAHLHPRWQVRLLPFLRKAFPKATFVVTTHSPLLARDTAPGEAYELVADGTTVRARRLGSPRDWYLADVLSEGFGVDLPLPGTVEEDGPSLLDELVSLSDLVKDHAATPDAALRERALALADRIAVRLPEDDPRARSVHQLKALLG